MVSQAFAIFVFYKEILVKNIYLVRIRDSSFDKAAKALVLIMERV